MCVVVVAVAFNRKKKWERSKEQVAYQQADEFALLF